MQENEDERIEKQPIEMTSDELLDCVVHPDIAEELKRRVRDEETDEESD